VIDFKRRVQKRGPALDVEDVVRVQVSLRDTEILGSHGPASGTGGLLSGVPTGPVQESCGCLRLGMAVSGNLRDHLRLAELLAESEWAGDYKPGGTCAIDFLFTLSAGD
jgi:hypothetical protein